MTSTLTVLLDLYPIIQADATLSALIGSRFYFGEWPQNEPTPGITYRRIGIGYEYLEDGTINVYKVKLEFTAHSESGEEAHRTIEALTSIFNGFRGDIGSTQVIQSLIAGGGEDTFDAELGLYHIPAIIEIWYVAG